MPVKRKNHYEKALKSIKWGSFNGLHEVVGLVHDEITESINTNSGSTETTILRTVDFEGERIKSRIYSNNIVAWILERGSGAYAIGGKHVGKSKGFINSGYTTWYLPVDKAPGLKNMIVEDTNPNSPSFGMQWYVMHGQPPQFIFTNAYLRWKKPMTNIIRRNIRMEMK